MDSEYHKIGSDIIRFSYVDNLSDFKPLPGGCPPPIVPPHEKPDECKMGYEVGKSISHTVANLVIPQLLSEDEKLNPFVGTTIF